MYDALGDIAYYDGDFELADEHWDHAASLRQEVARIEPDNVQLNVALGWQNMRDTNIAAPYIERALNRDPQHLHALNAAIVLMTRTWRNTSALQIAEYVAKRDPLFIAANWNLQRAYLNNGAFQKLEQLAREAVNSDPGRSGTRWHLGAALLLQGMPDEALEQFLQIDDDYFPYRLQGMAIALHQLGRHDKSEAALTELIERDTEIKDDELRRPDMIAFAYAGIGNSDKAFMYLEQARELTPGRLRVHADSPFYNNLREDTRWLPFLESAGLAPQQLAQTEFNPLLPVEIRSATNAN